MGIVYEAEQSHPRRTVALKVINAGVATPEMLQRFHHEAEVLARLQHPGIAQIYEAGTFDSSDSEQLSSERPYFAMELVHGEPVNSFVSKRNLGVRERLEVIAGICDAVQHAHQRGVIHRDLKPGNILVEDAVDEPTAAQDTAQPRRFGLTTAHSRRSSTSASPERPTTIARPHRSTRRTASSSARCPT
ncbi:MAG: protein kinase [Phycisphaerales bacterium]